MVAKSVKWALASLVVFSPAAAFGLGLGDIRLLSSLNAPLDAEIEVLGATPDEIANLKAQIASRDLFAEKGLDFPTSLLSVTVTSSRTADGRQVIRLRSRESMTEPFLTMLVEVNSTRSHLVREYSLLFDPPVFTPGDQRNNEPVQSAATGAGTREGAIERAPAQTPAPAPRQESAASTAPDTSRPTAISSSASAGTERTVRRGETLSGIANEVASGDAASSRAWMLAIYQANPSAFDGNMNVMRSGAVLRIPDNSTAAAISPSEAGAEIRRQWSAWRGGATNPSAASTASEQGRLRLVPPADTASGTSTAAGAAENTQLQSRVRELESQLQESKRLLDARNAELAQLQARLAQQQGAAATPPPAAAEPPPTEAPATAEPPAAAATPAPTPPVEEPAQQPEATPPAAAAEPTPEQPPAAESKPPAAAQTPAPAAASGSILDTLKEYWWAAAALVVVLLAIFGLKAARSRKRNEFDDSLSRLAASGADTLSRDSMGDTQPVRPVSRDREAFVVEESGTHERPRFGGDLGAAPVAPRNVPADETISSETAINLDQGDPLAEADFHMAYGLYDQAADLVRIAISREPDRRDLKLKLLEVFFVWGNKEQFLQTARELAETRERAAPGEWEKIVIMGKQLAPEDGLFSGGGGGSLGGVDLDLEGGQSRVDFDLLGEPVAQAGGAGVDLDIGSALGGDEPEGAATVTDANLALHEDGFTSDAGTATTRQMTQKIRDNAPTAAFAADLEAPTVEQPALARGGDNPTVRQKVEVAMRQSGQAAEQTAELAIDDLGLDLAALDTVDQPGLAATQESPTLVAGLDERSRRIMDEAERRGIPRDPDATAISSTGSWNLSSEDLDPTMPPTQVRAMENGDGTSETSRLQALKGSNDLDFNFNDVDAPAAAYTNGSGASSGVDLDVGTATIPDTAFTSTQKLNSEDLALPDLEPVTMSEVGTKLDLARAYMDMGDPEGARNILEEVLTEGSVAQKQEAQRLLESLPG
jgi:pilus assembly protein FimV